MSDKLSARELLQAFDHIQREGEQRNGCYFLNTLHGEVSHDGYTVTVGDERVSVSVGFHNSLSFDSPNTRASEQFRERIVALNRAYR